jgi:hypothetical protein
MTSSPPSDPAPLPACMLPDGGDGGDGCDGLRALVHERDTYRAVLEAAGYQRLDMLLARGPDYGRAVGTEVRQMTMAAMHAESVLQRLMNAQRLGSGGMLARILCALIAAWENEAPEHRDDTVAKLLAEGRAILDRGRTSAQ